MSVAGLHSLICKGTVTTDFSLFVVYEPGGVLHAYFVFPSQPLSINLPPLYAMHRLFESGSPDFHFKR